MSVFKTLSLPPVKERFEAVVRNLTLFDLLYDKLVENLPLIAGELRETNQITQSTMTDLLDKAFHEASESAPSLH